MKTIIRGGGGGHVLATLISVHSSYMLSPKILGILKRKVSKRWYPFCLLHMQVE